jgi:hypothetical protein
MAKLSVITDAKGNLLGAVRADTFKTSDGKSLEYRAHPNYKHHVIEVDEKLLKGPARELGKHLRENLK